MLCLMNVHLCCFSGCDEDDMLFKYQEKVNTELSEDKSELILVKSRLLQTSAFSENIEGQI